MRFNLAALLILGLCTTASAEMRDENTTAKLFEQHCAAAKGLQKTISNKRYPLFYDTLGWLDFAILVVTTNDEEKLRYFVGLTGVYAKTEAEKSFCGWTKSLNFFDREAEYYQPAKHFSPAQPISNISEKLRRLLFLEQHCKILAVARKRNVDFDIKIDIDVFEPDLYHSFGWPKVDRVTIVDKSKAHHMFIGPTGFSAPEPFQKACQWPETFYPYPEYIKREMTKPPKDKSSDLTDAESNTLSRILSAPFFKKTTANQKKLVAILSEHCKPMGKWIDQVKSSRFDQLKKYDQVLYRRKGWTGQQAIIIEFKQFAPEKIAGETAGFLITSTGIMATSKTPNICNWPGDGSWTALNPRYTLNDPTQAVKLTIPPLTSKVAAREMKLTALLREACPVLNDNLDNIVRISHSKTSQKAFLKDYGWREIDQTTVHFKTDPSPTEPKLIFMTGPTGIEAIVGDEFCGWADRFVPLPKKYPRNIPTDAPHLRFLDQAR